MPLGQWKWGDIAGSNHSEESGRRGRYPEHLALIHTLGKPCPESRDYPHDCFVWKCHCFNKADAFSLFRRPTCLGSQGSLFHSSDCDAQAQIWDTISSKLQTRASLHWLWWEWKCRLCWWEVKGRENLSRLLKPHSYLPRPTLCSIRSWRTEITATSRELTEWVILCFDNDN